MSPDAVPHPVPEHVADCPPPLPPSPPRFRPPPGACDCHFHVFGPFGRFPLAAQRTYTPPPSDVGAYRNLLAVLGLDRCVIVQPSVYGTDHRCTLAAAAELGASRCRVVGVVGAAATRAELERLHRAGMRGTRINAVAGGGPDADQIGRMARLVAPLGWHLQLFMPLDTLAKAAPLLRGLPVDVVIDHMGAPGPEAADHPELPTLLRLLEGGRTWIKLSGAYLGSAEPAPWMAMGRLAALLAAHRPDRLLWGTNWPHPARHAPMPTDADLLDAARAWLPDPALLHAVLVRNPAKLYGFGKG